MNGRETLYRLQFDDHLLVYDEVCAETVVYLQTIEFERDWDLILNSESPATEFLRQDKLINRFQKPWPKNPVNSDRGIDDLLGYLVRFGNTRSSFTQSRSVAEVGLRRMLVVFLVWTSLMAD